MSAFEEVINSVVQSYLNEHKHVAIANSSYVLEFNKEPEEHKLFMNLYFEQEKKIQVELHFSDWAINSYIATERVSSKIVFECAQMIEVLIPRFGIVYKSVKW